MDSLSSETLRFNPYAFAMDSSNVCTLSPQPEITSGLSCMKTMVGDRPTQLAPTLVVFDSRVADLEVLYEGLLPETIAYTLHPQTDALSAITRWLAETGAKRLAIVAHGEPGVVHIGLKPLNLQQLEAQAHLLQEWGVEEIALYSCEVATDPSFIATLEDLTKAKVAASPDKVGSSKQGGSWELNQKLSFSPFTSKALKTYQSTLAITSLTLNGVSTPIPGSNSGSGTVPTDTLFTATDASNVNINYSFDTTSSIGASLLMAIYSSNGTLLYWQSFRNTGSGTSFTSSFNLMNALGNYNGSFYFTFWQGTTNPNAPASSRPYSGAVVSFPTSSNSGFNYRGQSATSVSESNIDWNTASAYNIGTSVYYNTGFVTVNSFNDDAGFIQAPAAANGTTTDDTTPAFSGTAPANTQITINYTGAASGLATVTSNASGVWSWTPTLSTNGTYNVTASFNNGGITATSNSFTFTLDTIALAPGVALINDTGSSNTDRITNNAALTLSNLETSATVQYSTDNGQTWTSSFTPAQGSNTVLVRQVDVAGNNSTSTTFTFTFDNVAPTASTLGLALDSGSSNSDGVTNSGVVNVSGLEAGSIREYSINNGQTWTAFSGAGFTLSADGAKSVIVRQTDLAGNISTSNPFNFTLDTTAPGAAALSLALDSGSSNSDRITNSSVVNVSGLEAGSIREYSTNNGQTWTAFSGTSFTLGGDGAKSVIVRQTDLAGNISTSNPFNFTLDTFAAAPGVALSSDTGSYIDRVTNKGDLAITAENGATIQYSTDNGQTWTSSFTPVEGNNTVWVRQTDTAGNISASTSFSFTLDTIALPPEVALVYDTGTSNSDKTTNYGVLSVTPVTGAMIEYSTNNGQTWIGSFTPVEGNNTILVRQTDTAGNISDPTSFSFTLDTTIIAPGVVLANDTGFSSSDKITRDGALSIAAETGATIEYSFNGGGTWTHSFTPVEGSNTFLVRQIDAAGNTSTVTSFSFTLDTTIQAPGVTLVQDTGTSNSDRITSNGALAITAENGARIEYSLNGGNTWTTSFIPVEGLNTVQVRQIDVAGNVSVVTPLNFTVDTIAPNALAIALTNDSGSSGDNITNDANLTVSGIEPDANVEYKINNGDWSSVYLTPVTDGDYVVQVRQVDQAGNVSNPASVAFTRDTTAPVAPAIGAIATDNIINVAEAVAGVELTGTTEAGSQVSLIMGGQTRNAVVSGTTWSYTLTNADLTVLGEGTGKTITVLSTDRAGNTTSSISQPFSIDTTTVEKPVIAIVSGDDRISLDEKGQGTTISGTAEANSIISLSWGNTTVTIQADANGAWSQAFTPEQIPDDGSTVINVSSQDAAGNVSAIASRTVQVDTVIVAPTINVVSYDDQVNYAEKMKGVVLYGTAEPDSYVTIVWGETTLTSRTDTNGKWVRVFPSTEIPTGSNTDLSTISVTTQDDAGNISSTVTRSVHIDTVVPDAPAIIDVIDDVGSIQGSVANAGRTDDTTPTFVIGLNNSHGAGDVLQLINGSTVLATRVLTNQDIADGSVSLTSTALLDRYYVITAHIKDMAGNQSVLATNRGLTVDTIANTPNFYLASDSGISNADKITRSGLVYVAGIEVGGTWQYSIDEGQNWITGTGASFTLTGDGLKKVIVRQTDVVGNTSTSTPTPLVFTLDTTIPTGTVISSYATTSETNTLTLTGKAEAGSTVFINVGSTTLGTTIATGDGSWSFDAVGSLVGGNYSVLVRAMDVAGNSSVFATARVVAGDGLDNTLTGAANADIVVGYSGRDLLNGSGGNDHLFGGNGDDTLVGGVGADLLTGSFGADTFRFNLADSLLSNIDHVTDLEIGIDSIDGPTAVDSSRIFNAGAIATLTESGISAALTTSNFSASGAAVFTVGTRTFVALNNATAGFSATTDAIVEITGYTGNLNNLSII
ncbi:Ig-like domain-containing protein [Leptolyngbya sp. FACHB-16]|uniref:Ig-like domain-containing protein n=1 Tax=unclassified Leptolyngbya TaxID=2650499 RepID=UPI001683D06A|nr:Ig-like domain-containing protein [Leptolyngbya sp. FACHB-16]MBD2156189.1 DUF4347 domain-containing protein [Leptolyngbya sp. FACHB-16]